MVYLYHNFLMHSPTDGPLGCFHVLAIINSAAMNTGVHMSLSILEKPNLYRGSYFGIMPILRYFHLGDLSGI